MAWEKDSHWSVYALKDPRDSAIRYVGVTFHPRRRLRDHCSEALRGEKRTYKCHWIRSLLSLGMEPIVEILDTGSGDFAASEMQWIAKMKSEGHRLTNATDGGEGLVGYVRTVEDRRKLSDAHKGYVMPQEQRSKISESLRGRPKNEKQRACLYLGHQALRGKPISEETRRKHQMVRHSDETKRKMSTARRGKTFSDEARKHMSEGARRRVQTETGAEQLRLAVRRASVVRKIRAGTISGE